MILGGEGPAAATVWTRFVSATARDSPRAAEVAGGPFSVERNQFRGLSRDTNPFFGLAVAAAPVAGAAEFVAARPGVVVSAPPEAESNAISRAARIGSSSVRRTISIVGAGAGGFSIVAGGDEAGCAGRIAGGDRSFACAAAGPAKGWGETAKGLLAPKSGEGGFAME